jgi:hypothetical protein
MSITKEDVARVMDEVEDEEHDDDDQYWIEVHERLGLEYGEVFEIIAADLHFFGMPMVH